LWIDEISGEVIASFEDVGRHNALDKLIGYGQFGSESVDSAGADLQSNWNRAGGFVLMTSRASYELVRKCCYARLPVLATISAPSSLAVRLARQKGLHLLSYCRENSLNWY
jgi:FdhD protein